MTLPEPEQTNLLTRMAFLAHETINAQPVQQNLKIQEILLYNPIPPPKNCDVVKPPQVHKKYAAPKKIPNATPYIDDAQCNKGETYIN